MKSAGERIWALFAPENAALLCSLAIAAGYALLPVAIASQLDNASSFYDLALIAMVASCCVFVGSRIPLLDRMAAGQNRRLRLDEQVFLAGVWSVFGLFAVVALATAQQIPLIAAMSGMDSETVAVLREQFLKAREGWQASFVYVNALLTGALVPYALAKMFLSKHRLRWLAFLLFFLYCISFVEKAFFAKAMLPLFCLAATGSLGPKLSPTRLVAGMLLTVFAITLVSGAGASESTGDADFFSVTYAPESPIQHLIWRSVAIPLITAVDSVRVLYDDFGGQWLLGATSSLVAAISGQERIEFERLVFAAQWGQNETGTGSSNSVYFIEAYVNFGYLGVILFSLVVGQAFRVFARSVDKAFGALWLLFFFGVYTSGLIGLLASNGFAMLAAIGLLARLGSNQRAPRRAPPEPSTSAGSARPSTSSIQWREKSHERPQDQT